MDIVRVISYYHGKWITLEETSEILAYEGGNSKRIRLRNNTSLDALHYLASQLFGVDRDTHTMYMRYSAKDSVSGIVKFIKMRDFIDLDYFLNQESQTMVPLYIEAQAKEVSEPAILPPPPPPPPTIPSNQGSNVLHEARTSQVSYLPFLSAEVEVPGVSSEPFSLANSDSTEIMYGDIDYSDNDENERAPPCGGQSRLASHQQLESEVPAIPAAAVIGPDGCTCPEVEQHYVGPDRRSQDSVVTERQATHVHKRRKAASSPACFEPHNI